VRYFVSRHIPCPHRILLIESGSRSLLEKLRPGLLASWGEDVDLDVVTCYARLPEGFPAHTRVYRTGEYRGRDARRRLYRELRRNRYALVGMIVSGEPVLLKWKWAIALRLPAKLFLINENGDYFWFDRGHLDLIRQLVLLRTGLAGSGAVRTLTRALSFPFTFVYLVLYATVVHACRAARLTFGG
jgi:hypothetical protein